MYVKKSKTFGEQKAKREKVTFACKARVKETEKRQAENGNEYYVITTGGGVKMLTYSQVISELAIEAKGTEDIVTLKGSLSFAVGSTFLILETVENISTMFNLYVETFDQISHDN